MGGAFCMIHLARFHGFWTQNGCLSRKFPDLAMSWYQPSKPASYSSQPTSQPPRGLSPRRWSPLAFPTSRLFPASLALSSLPFWRIANQKKGCDIPVDINPRNTRSWLQLKATCVDIFGTIIFPCWYLNIICVCVCLDYARAIRCEWCHVFVIISSEIIISVSTFIIS